MDKFLEEMLGSVMLPLAIGGISYVIGDNNSNLLVKDFGIICGGFGVLRGAAMVWEVNGNNYYGGN
jgi:hypothetical protein